MLDFIDSNGTRCDDTHFHLHFFKFPSLKSEDEPLKPMGTYEGYGIPDDMYILTAPYEYEVCDSHRRRLKGFSFYKRRGTYVPIFFD